MIRELYESFMRWYWEGELANAKARIAELEAEQQMVRNELGEAKFAMNKAHIRLVAYARLV